CIAALRGQQERALELLEECRKAGTLPPRHHLETDKGLDSLRNLDAFREFLKRSYPVRPDDQADDSV
ncbi:TPR end-of-group domain-containing protein, partial [Desulfovibrio sp.]|uniref:TPR end-of-group domain-containing protein n=1 Tax=Desulfovibrio sp. TaxID=885 RepID=UPI003FF07278